MRNVVDRAGRIAPARWTISRLPIADPPLPRTRRTADGALAAAAAAALAAVVVAVGLDPHRSGWGTTVVPRAVSDGARTAVAVVNVGSSLAVVALVLLIAADAARQRRFALVSAALACGLALLLGIAVAAVTNAFSSGSFAVLLGQLDDADALPVMATVALALGMGLRWRRRTRLLELALALAIVCALALGSLTVVSAVYSLLAGATAALAVRFAVGVPPQRPTERAIRQALSVAGWPAVELRTSLEAPGRIRYTATLADGGALSVTVVDPDRRGVPFLRPAWRLLRLRTSAAGRPSLSLRGQLEREALSGALAGAAGVTGPRPAGMITLGRSLMLVQRPLEGAELFTGAPERDAGMVMRALKRLHRAGLSHGALTADALVALPGGEAGFLDFGAAQPAATELQRELDVVAALVSVAGSCGATTAVHALRTHYGSDHVSETRLAALLQPLALPSELRSVVRGTARLKEVRSALTGESVTDGQASIRLERLPARTVAMVAGATIAAHLLATQLSSVGLASAFAQARPGWLAVAALASAVTYLGSALALHAFATVPLSLRRSSVVQLATSFLALVAPPAVGHVGLNVRYLQKAGAPVPAAATTVAVKEAVTVALTVPLLLACGWLSGVSPSRLTLLPSGGVLAVLAVVAAALVLLVALPVTRRQLQHRVQPVLRRTLPQLVDAASDPRRLGTATVGVLLLNAGYVAALAASLHAFSVSLPLPTLLVVYLAASTLGSAAPTPGGLGAVEAALVGGLTAFGVPFASGLTAVLAFRAVTFWLPAPLGWFALTRLQHQSAL